MSETCDTGYNGCSVTCEGDCCYAYYFPDTGVCVKGCCDKSFENLSEQFNLKSTLDSKVSLSIVGIELWKVAQMFNSILEEEIHIPASVANEKISKSISNCTIADVISNLGLKHV